MSDGSQQFVELLLWMDRTQVPRSRPAASAADEAAGLVILDLALRLEHVARVTDSLRVIDRSHARRSVTLDVDLRGLTGEQRDALAVRRGTTPRGDDDRDRASHLWVPVSRHSRMDLSPVVVRDASDQVLPRLTHAAASRTLVAGLSRLLKIIRDSSGAGVSREAMWLTIKALQSLVQHGPLRYDARDRLVPTGARGTSGVEERRAEAKEFLLGMPSELRQSLDRLIEVAYSEYMLVVMLPARTSQAHLRYEAPLIPAAGPRRSRLRDLSPGREYTIDYRTEVARSLGSYHVTVEVAEEIYVRRYILTSGADRAAVGELGRDMRRLAAALGPAGAGPGGGDAGPAVVARAAGLADAVPADAACGRRRPRPGDEALALELEAILWKLAQIGRRRSLEWRRYREYIDHELRRTPKDRPPDPPPPAASVLQGLARGDVTLASLDWLADISAARPLRDSLADAGLRPESFAEGLPVIAQWLEDARLGEDVVVENDPRENGAHAQWGQQPLDFGTPSLEPIDARVFLTLADEKPALADSVRHMVLSLTAIAAGLGLLLRFTRVPDSDIQSDALVAVLLLVPGILLSRLDIPSTNSVLGQLRAVPRNIAYLSVILTSGLAVAVATGWARKGVALPFLFVVGALLSCYAATWAEKISRTVRRNREIPSAADVPWWLGNEHGDPVAAGAQRRRSADVVFDAIDGRSADGADTAGAAMRRPWALRRWLVPAFGARPPRLVGADPPGAGADRTSAGRRLLRGADLARSAARTVTAGRGGTELVVEHRFGSPRPGGREQARTRPRERPGAGRGQARDGAVAPAVPLRPTESVQVLADGWSICVSAIPLTSAAPSAPLATELAAGPSTARYRVAAPLAPGSFNAPLQVLTFLVGPLSGTHVAAVLLALLTDGDSEADADADTDTDAARRRAAAAAVIIRDVRYPESHAVDAGGPGGAGDDAVHDMLRVSMAVSDTLERPAARKARPGTAAGVDEVGAAEDGHPAQRLALIAKLESVSADAQAALYVHDPSAGAGPHWRAVVPRPAPAPGGCASTMPGGASASGRGSDAERLLLATLAGSASGYDVNAAVELCSVVKKAAASVRAVSVARAQDQPLISLVLARDSARGGTRAADDTPARSRPAVEALTEFLAADRADSKRLQAACEGRALVVTQGDGPRGDCTGASGPARGHRTLWVQWAWPPSTEGTPLMPDPMRLVADALAEAGVCTAVLDQRARQDRDGRVRGSARLLADVPTGLRLGPLAHRSERAAQTVLAQAHRSPHEVRLRVVQHEGWLASE